MNSWVAIAQGWIHSQWILVCSIFNFQIYSLIDTTFNFPLYNFLEGLTLHTAGMTESECKILFHKGSFVYIQLILSLNMYSFHEKSMHIYSI